MSLTTAHRMCGGGESLPLGGQNILHLGEVSLWRGNVVDVDTFRCLHFGGAIGGRVRRSVAAPLVASDPSGAGTGLNLDTASQNDGEQITVAVEENGVGKWFASGLHSSGLIDIL